MVLDAEDPGYDFSYLQADLSSILTLASPPNELLLLRLPSCGAGETFDRGSASDFGSTLAFRMSLPEPSDFERAVKLGLADPFDIVGI